MGASAFEVTIREDREDLSRITGLRDPRTHRLTKTGQKVCTLVAEAVCSVHGIKAKPYKKGRKHAKPERVDG